MGQSERMPVMKNLTSKLLLSGSLMMAGFLPVQGQEQTPIGNMSIMPPASVQTMPDAGQPSTLPIDQSDQSNDEEGDELHTDNEAFAARGFMDFDWQTHTSYVKQVLDEVVLPDYVKRTGKMRPENPSIDVAAAMITNPYFNDLIVQSRLPGDCKPDGCLVQIYSLVGELWVKKFQTTTFAIMAKPGDKLGTVLIGLVGNDEYPSKTVIWTGSVFKDQ
jgi:hypothetical protein